ncbi:hypothetical protein [Pseudorhodobacter sp. E13]|uniref:hypothetical protein n=1 Tax=Pseudorhodobacter sp. E13 TaxID=2487931 RepID=UPI00131505D3|nr:hypothetical protein [Pseudorhodobacter sp. E13]
MTTARALITDRRRREALAGDCFDYRLLRMDRNRVAQLPLSLLFRTTRSRQAA